jgi:hypothetical protein
LDGLHGLIRLNSVEMAIEIKKSHVGMFTAYKKRTGKTTQEALHSKDPHVRKMAQFAINAKHFKH